MANLNDVVTNQIPTMIQGVKVACDSIETACEAIQADIGGAVISPVGGLSCTPISISASGDNTIIAAPGAGKHLAIYRLVLVVGSEIGVILKSGAAEKTGAMSMRSIIIDFDRTPLECGTNEAFIINLASAVATAGFVQHRTVTE